MGCQWRLPTHLASPRRSSAERVSGRDLGRSWRYRTLRTGFLLPDFLNHTSSDFRADTRDAAPLLHRRENHIHYRREMFFDSLGALPADTLQLSSDAPE